MKKVGICVLVWCFLLGGLSAKGAIDVLPKEEIVTLDFLFESDFVGYLEETSFSPGAALYAAYQEYYRANNREGTFLLSAGDAISGTPLANLFLGMPVIEVMNLVGYDAMTIGNHELDWGIEETIETFHAASFPLLAGNIYDRTTEMRVSWAKPYTIIEKKGVKVGIVGFVTIETPRITRASSVEPLLFTDPIKEAKKLIPEMREQGADIVIALCHLPVYHMEDGSYQGEAIDLLQAVSGIDAMIAGHQEEAIAIMFNSIPVVQTRHYGSMMGRISLSYDLIHKNIIFTDMELIPVLGNPLQLEKNAEVAALVEVYRNKLGDVLHEVIGHAVEELQDDPSCTKETATGNWWADATRVATGTDIAFLNSSGLRHRVPTGPITLSDIYEISPYENNLVTTHMTGKDLHHLFELTLDSSRIRDMGALQISGMNLVWDSRLPDGQKIVTLTLSDGSPILHDQTYTVSTIDFLATGGNGYNNLTLLQWDPTGILSRAAVVEYLQEVNTLANTIEGRIINLGEN